MANFLEIVRKERIRRLSGVICNIYQNLLPAMGEGHQKDLTESILRTLILMQVDEQWSSSDTNRLTRESGLLLELPDVPYLARERLRQQISTPTYLDHNAELALSLELQIQTLIAKQRDTIHQRLDSADAAITTEVSTESYRIRLQQYLRDRFSLDDITVTQLSLLPGGRSKLTFSVMLMQCGNLPERLILRLDQGESIISSQAASEFPLLEMLWQQGVPVPQPLLVETDLQPLGGTFILVELLEGHKAGEYFPELEGDVRGDVKLGLDLADILGKLHSIPVKYYPGKSINLPASAYIENLQEEILHTYQKTLVVAPRMVEFELAYQYLQEHLQYAAGTPRITHGDVGLHNLMRHSNQLVGLLDWELSSIGPAAGDLGACRHLIQVLMPWKQFEQAYLSAGGCPNAIQPAHLQFHTVLRGFRVVAISQLFNHMFVSESTEDFVIANAGCDSATRARALLTTLMTNIFHPLQAENNL